MKTYRITFPGKRTILTDFNGDLNAARDYYMFKVFRLEDGEEATPDLNMIPINVEEVRNANS